MTTVSAPATAPTGQHAAIHFRALPVGDARQPATSTSKLPTIALAVQRKRCVALMENRRLRNSRKSPARRAVTNALRQSSHSGQLNLRCNHSGGEAALIRPDFLRSLWMRTSLLFKGSVSRRLFPKPSRRPAPEQSCTFCCQLSAVGQSVPPPVELTGFKVYHL